MDERLSKVEFYKNLDTKVRKRVDLLLHKELDKDDVRTRIEEIDVEKGYDFKEDDECFIEALN